MAQDPDMQALYCAWADAKWPQHAPVEEVEFDIGEHGPYSEVTPDVDAYLAVGLKTRDGWLYEDVPRYYLTETISEILCFERTGSLEAQ